MILTKPEPAKTSGSDLLDLLGDIGMSGEAPPIAPVNNMNNLLDGGGQDSLFNSLVQTNNAGKIAILFEEIEMTWSYTKSLQYFSIFTCV